MSKLPGHDGHEGEVPNRHKKGRKRRRKQRGPQQSGFQSGHANSESTGKSENRIDSLRGARNGGKKPTARRSENAGNGRKVKPASRLSAYADGDGGKSVGRSTHPDRNKQHSGLDGSDDRIGRPNVGGSTTSDAGQTRRNKSRKSRKNRQRSAGDSGNRNLQLARGMRMPPQPVPDVSYNPADRKSNGGAPPNRDGVAPSSHRIGSHSPGKSWSGGRGKAPNGSNSSRRKVEPYAALDLGTNNCRLLVALPQERGRFRVIDGFSRIVRLGEGLGRNDRLSDEAMDRALEALKVCSQKLITHNIRRHRLIATEACRQAQNGAHFLERVRAETGMKLEIINRQTEAHLAAEGCGSLMDRKADAAVLFDIGGGSSELVLMDRRQRKARISQQIAGWTSLPVGVVTLAERHGGKDVNRAVFNEMVAEVRGYIEAFEGRSVLDRLWKTGRVHLLGTSGTVTTLAGIHLELPRYERRLVDGLWMHDADIDKVMNELIAMDYQQRAASPCIGQERADLVLAGCAILEAIRQTWPSKRLRVADRGLREGILTEMMERDAAWLPPKANRKNRYPSGRHFGSGNQRHPSSAPGNGTAHNASSGKGGRKP